MEETKIYSESERNWGMFCHLSALSGLFIPMGGILGPLIFWLVRKEESDWVNRNGKASLNFQLSMLLYFVLCIPLFILLIGFLFLAVLIVLDIICVVLASVKSANEQTFNYPLSIPFFQ